MSLKTAAAGIMNHTELILLRQRLPGNLGNQSCKQKAALASLVLSILGPPPRLAQMAALLSFGRPKTEPEPNQTPQVFIL